MTEYVYHASSKSGLSEILPNVSTHGKSYVYAALDPIYAPFFITNREKSFGDFSLYIARCHETGKPLFCERHRDALKDAFEGMSGSLYKLKAHLFESKTSWLEEVVSECAVPVEREEPIPDVYSLLLKNKREGSIVVYSYPNRPHYIPHNDGDLVHIAATCIVDRGMNYWGIMKVAHPHLCKNILKMFHDNNIYSELPKRWEKIYSPQEIRKEIGRLKLDEKKNESLS